MIDQDTLEGKVVTAALDLAASSGWTDVSLRDIADAAGVPLADVMERFGDKSDILAAFVTAVDRDMLRSAGDVERTQAPRDAVFEVIMSRFDIMAPHKAALKSIVAARPAGALPDPALLRMTLRSQHKVLQAAGISADGAPALLRQLGLARIYGDVFRIWLDDGDGMSRTMAALDKRLRQGEQTLRLIEDATMSLERACARSSAAVSDLIARIRPFGSRTTSSPSNDTSPPGAAPGEPAGGADPGPTPAGGQAPA